MLIGLGAMVVRVVVPRSMVTASVLFTVLDRERSGQGKMK